MRLHWGSIHFTPCTAAAQCRLHLQSGGLAQADTDLRHAQGRLLGTPLSDATPRLASPGAVAGGVGARSALEHAPAACAASLASTGDLSMYIWPTFDPLDGGLSRPTMEETFQRSFPADAAVFNESYATFPLDTTESPQVSDVPLRFGRPPPPNPLRTLSDPGRWHRTHFTAQVGRNSHPIAAIPSYPQAPSWHASL